MGAVRSMAMSSSTDAMTVLLLLAMSMTATPGSANATEAPRVLAQAASQAWTAKVDTNPRGVSIEARASSGTARLTGGCATTLLSPGLWMTLFNPPGRPRSTVGELR